MWTLIVVNLISGGFTTTEFHNFSSQLTCESAKTSIINVNKTLGTKPGVFQLTCVQN